MPRHPLTQRERHRGKRIGWLRAAVLGANDGIVSTACLVVGVAAAGRDRSNVLVAGVAGLVAGAMSMAAGEYVSVSSQADTERADLDLEKRELATTPDLELHELQNVYIERGLNEATALEVAKQLTHHDALGAHARDELGFSEITSARPIQAAMASAVTYSVGAALPLVTAALVPIDKVLVWVSVLSLAFLGALGAVSAWAGGASRWRAAARVTFWGAVAMAITALIGKLFGTVV